MGFTKPSFFRIEDDLRTVWEIQQFREDRSDGARMNRKRERFFYDDTVVAPPGFAPNGESYLIAVKLPGSFFAVAEHQSDDDIQNWHSHTVNYRD